MTMERTQEVEFIRSDIVGPSRNRFDQRVPISEEDKVTFDASGKFLYPDTLPGLGLPVFWRPDEKTSWQEVIHFRNESPLNKYGAGLLYPDGLRSESIQADRSDIAVDEISEVISIEEISDEVSNRVVDEDQDQIFTKSDNYEPDTEITESYDNDFDVTSSDVFKPSSLGVSFCLSDNEGEIIISLPDCKHFFWQQPNDEAFQVNGGYQKCGKDVNIDGERFSYPAWRRIPATNKESFVRISVSEFINGKKQSLNIPMEPSSPIKLKAELFPRKIRDQWLITIVIRNVNDASALSNNEKLITHTLFQSYFEVSVKKNTFAKYPEGTRPFEQYDEDEKTLALLYRDSAIWAIGHGCAAGWDAQLGQTPDILFGDIMPAAELPSMTPDIKDKDSNDVSLSMFELSKLPSYDTNHTGWQSLENLATLYANWVNDKQAEAKNIDGRFNKIANSHMDACLQCQRRIERGISILKTDGEALMAFKLANKSMLLQQIASKKLQKRALQWNGYFAEPKAHEEDANNPYQMLEDGNFKNVGAWRAFQIAFLLLSIEGMIDENGLPDKDRELVDLIWFPTGGGKTEAYLAVASFYMFHQRILMSNGTSTLERDGTNVFMRYTLRMLTTQQFQRAASLICAMEFLRIKEPKLRLGDNRFSLGLWIGGDGAPNSCEAARAALSKFKKGDIQGNPLVLTECPWCKSEIGVLPNKPPKMSQKVWQDSRLAGINLENINEPVLTCSDSSCHFGEEYASLPIEVIDERIYKHPPSMFIGTADKFAMIAYKPEAGALFGRMQRNNDTSLQVKMPPGLIIQDEFHLISGPLGTMYGAYEGILEELCTMYSDSGLAIKPKIIAATATIRGASEQVKSIYARDRMQLFPSPGLLMKDSFFGRYATEDNSEKLKSGRLYLGIHAHGYSSFLTTQVRLFTAALFRSWFFDDDKKDPWWTLLAFYNSIRELGGARTLFSSDIAARLKNYFFRYGTDKMRYLGKVEELTSRKNQAELVHMMERLSSEWSERASLDACLSSSIIEVGVDIERLSLMAVVGQPKSTAQYIQVTGRVGRKWWERPGLILAMFNPSKSRDRSHFEQFHSYHRRLYERVEPTSATPFSTDAIERATTGVLLLWARQFYTAESPDGQYSNYARYLQKGKDILITRSRKVISNTEDLQRSISSIEKVHARLQRKWENNPQKWQEYPQKTDGEYLMLWPGQMATEVQKTKGELVPSSMRNVDGSANLKITQNFYLLENVEEIDNGQ